MSNTYTDQQNSRMFLTIPVSDVLSYFGKRADHRNYMYYSPFRDEATPSMRVTVDRSTGTWVWADYGGMPEGGKHVDGGGVLDLVMKLANVSSYKAAFDILEQIGRSRGIEVIRQESSRNRREVKESGVVIDDISEEFTNKALRDYAVSSRCINQDILSRYCRQVSYHFKSNPQKINLAIGFPNNNGGFALRGNTRNRKLNSVWGLSVLDPSGVLRKDAGVNSDRCILFEGFMDFLSYMSWRGIETPGCDVCVLHSVSNVVHAKDWLLSHTSVRTFFDNDVAGQKATDTVKNWCAAKEGVSFKDGSGAYAGSKDLNEGWQKVCARRKGMAEGMAVENKGLTIK